MVGVVVRRDEDEFARYLKRKQGAVAESLEKRGLDPREVLKTEVGFLASLARLDGAPLEFDNFQLRFLACRERFRSLLKARQIGYSFVMAAEMLARAHLNTRYTAICVSFNLDDAKDKITLIKLLHDELPLGYQKRICIDSKTVVGFESRDSRRKVALIQSLPSKAPRGKSGDCYVDEFAFCLNDRQIYTGASSLTIRSKGQLTIGSTPFGQRGKFYEIHEGKAEGAGAYWRMDIPWWLCKLFCRDVRAASVEAPLLPTAQRVARFGTRDLVDVFSANTEDDFKQEYELEFQDERVAYYPAGLVLPCCSKDAGEKDDKETIRKFASPEELAEAAGDLGPLFAGFDVGRTKHPSELYIVEQVGNAFVERLTESYLDLPFQAQFARLSHILEIVPLKAFRGDATGMGKQIMEDLRKKFGPKIEEWTFTNQNKADLAANLKILLEGRLVELVKTRSIINQLGSIRQKITEVGNVMFEVKVSGGGKENKHHGDKVWALALACWRKLKKKWGPVDVGVRILGAPPPKRDAKATTEVTTSPARRREPARIEELNNVSEHMTPRRPEFAPDLAATEVLEGRGTPDMYPDVPTPVLERRARMLNLSLRSWAAAGRGDRDGDVASGRAELRGLLGELGSRNVVTEF